MVFKCRVQSERSESYVGKKGPVSEVRVALLDVDARSECRLINSFDYTLTPEEKTEHAGKLADKIVEVGVTEFTPWNGRLRARGKLLSVSK